MSSGVEPSPGRRRPTSRWSRPPRNRLSFMRALVGDGGSTPGRWTAQRIDGRAAFLVEASIERTSRMLPNLSAVSTYGRFSSREVNGWSISTTPC